MNAITNTLIDKAAKVGAIPACVAGSTGNRLTKDEMKAAITEYVEEVRQMRIKFYADRFPTLMGRDGSEETYVEFGRRYAKLICGRKGSARSVHSFVDMTNGDILKSATWRAPAKIARGNIFDADRMSNVNEYGARYL